MDCKTVLLLVIASFGLTTIINAEASSSFPAVHHNWTRSESMDQNGLLNLEWRLRDKEIIFKATVNSRGFIAIGFVYQNIKITAFDLALAWIDDRSGKANILDCHGKNNQDMKFEGLVQDDTQNYVLENEGYQNLTHTVITFRRALETCDPRDVPLTSDTMRIFWAFGDQDVISDQLGRVHYKNKGMRVIHLLSPMFKKPRAQQNIRQWDVTVKNITIDEATDTLYWCKIIKAPPLHEKHHIIGFEALLTRDSSTKKSLVHHMTLFECKISSFPGSDSSSWDVWVKSNGAVCNSNMLTPRDWDSCITPVASWGVGSTGQFLPEHVGIPFGDKNNNQKYYLLEIHYDNANKKRFVDHSGFRLHYTKELRQHDGGMMITGVSVSDTQMIPPKQKLYRNVGICGPSCTGVVFPESGINIIAAALHTHKAGKKIKLRHIRNGQELDTIVEDDTYNHNYQQTRQLANETTVLPGDYMIIDCSYETLGRNRPTLGGYSTKQEMCLSFITYYPKIDLAGCYSMIPVKEFFEYFGVNNFYSINMTDVENVFLYGNDVLSTALFPQDDDNHKVMERLGNTNMIEEDDKLYKDSILNKLIIADPVEFHDRTFWSHLSQLPWNDPLFARRVEQIILTGRYMLFCRVVNDSISVPTEIIKYPNFTSLVTPANDLCPYQSYSELYGNKGITLKVSTALFYFVVSVISLTCF